MLYTPIRLINDGEALDEVTLNRMMLDTRTNLEELFARVNGAVNGSGTPDLIPDTIVKRDEDGTAKFGEPTELEHPVRLADTNKLFPRGIIAMWSGAVSEIPAGWALCTGADGTPNLVDRFVVGAGGDHSVGDTGGSSSTTITIPDHYHGVGQFTEYGNDDAYFILGKWNDGDTYNTRGLAGDWDDRETSRANGSSSNSIRTSGPSNAGSSTVDITPPFYALAYIMKT